MGVGEADIEARDRLSREIVDCETWFRGRCTAGFTRFFAHLPHLRPLNGSKKRRF